jgi:peptidoglycan/LPS O-acetylase OafA/YrhL
MASYSTPLPKYRSDIDGLRALAVIPVCFFHAGLTIFPGGFVGVDIFFVISGYLMTRIIGQSLSRKTFSSLDFYKRRILRIFPALFAVLFFIFAVAAWIVPPKLFRDLGFTLICTVVFISNFAFWRKSANYFDAPSELNPLLHTWSLAVEEQFYILFPLFLKIIWPLRHSAIFFLMLGIALVSLGLSMWGTVNAPTATFYLLPTRGWELLAGALVALWHLRANNGTQVRLEYPRWIDAIAGLLGLGAIFWSLIFYNSETAFPGAAALLPCLGAALLLHTGQNDRNPAVRLLGFRPFAFLGKISYSLYLWHWPLLVFARQYLTVNRQIVLFPFLMLLLSGCIAYVSWRWVEQPWRRLSGWRNAKVYGVATAGTAILAMAGVFAQASDGWRARFPGMAAVAIEPQIAREAAEDRGFNSEKCFVDNVASWGSDACFLSTGLKTTALLWGDSFAANYSYGFFSDKDPKFNVLQFTSPRCPPIIDYDAASRPECTAFNSAVRQIVKRYGISIVIMAANWESYINRRKTSLEEIGKTVSGLQQDGVKIVLVGQSPTFIFIYPDEYLFNHYDQQTARNSYEAKINAPPLLNDRLRQTAHPDFFFDPMDSLCRQDQCTFRDSGDYLFYDYGHFTHAGSTRMVAALKTGLASSGTFLGLLGQ